MSISNGDYVFEHEPGSSQEQTTVSARVVYFVDLIANRLSNLVEKRPNTSRFLIASFVALVLVLMVARRAHGQQLLQKPIEIGFDLAYSKNIFYNSIALAQYIFATLAGLTVIVRGLAYYIKNQSVRGLGQVILSSVLSLGLPFVIISIAPTIIPSVSMVGLQVADIVTGNAGSQIGDVTPVNGVIPPDQVKGEITNLYHNMFSSSANVNEVSPSTIVNTGVELGYPLIQRAVQIQQTDATPTTGQNSTMFNSEQSFATIIEYLGIATIGAFVFIAVELVMAYLQVYLVLPVAAFTLGFLGLPATRSFGTGYWQAVIQALVRFTTILFVIGFALTLADTYRAYFATIVTAQIPTAGTPDITFKGAITAAGLSFALLYIVRVLPSMFMSIVSGATIGAEGSTGNFEYQGSNALQSGRVGRGGGPAARNTSGRLNTPGAPSSYT